MILDIKATVEVDLQKNVNNGNRWRMLSSGLTRIAYIVKNSGRDENDNIMEMAKCILDNNSGTICKLTAPMLNFFVFASCIISHL